MRLKCATLIISAIPGLKAFGASYSNRLSLRNVFKEPTKLGLSSNSAKSANGESGEGAVTLPDVTMRMIEESLRETDRVEQFYKKMSFRTPTIWQSQEACSDYVKKNIDTILFDCDGVLYRTLDTCPGASETINRLLAHEKKVLFVTNNAGVNRRQLREKLSKLLGIDSLTNDSMVSSSYSCAQFLKQNLKEGSRVHVIGSAGFCEELESSGFLISGGPSSDLPSMDREELAQYDFDESPIDAIAVGHDTDFNFRKLTVACNLFLRNPECLFVATNHDSFDLVGSDGRHIPGNGCAVKALEYCSRRESINVGKPSKTLAELIQVEHDLDPSRCLFVGDRLDTDIRFGNESGMKSLLVMTGVTTAQYLKNLGEGTEEEPLPHFILPHVGMLV